METIRIKIGYIYIYTYIQLLQLLLLLLHLNGGTQTTYAVAIRFRVSGSQGACHENGFSTASDWKGVGLRFWGVWFKVPPKP